MKGIKIGLIGLLFLMLTFASANYAGICLKNASWLNDKEIINLAVKRILLRQKTKHFHTDGTITIDEPIPYKSVNEFLGNNPQCCNVSAVLDTPEGTMHAPFIDKITGHFHKFVTINYQKRYDIDNTVIQKPAYKIYKVKNCGSLYY